MDMVDFTHFTNDIILNYLQMEILGFSKISENDVRLMGDSDKNYNANIYFSVDSSRH